MGFWLSKMFESLITFITLRRMSLPQYICSDMYQTTWKRWWHNVYHRRKWIRRPEFESCNPFHLALISSGKEYIQLFFLQLWVNRRAGWVLCSWYGNRSRRRETLYWNLLNSAKKLTLYHLLFVAKGLGKYVSIYLSISDGSLMNQFTNIQPS